MPIPMPPVSPRMMIAQEVGGHEPPKLVIHPGFNAEPGAKAGDGLMQQHAETLDTAQALRAGGCQQSSSSGT